MDKIYYKNKLKNALVKGAIANKAIKDFVALVDRQGSLIGLITARIMELTPISPSDAKTYIDYKTGKFKGGSGMTYCLDPKLKQLFAEHESIVIKKREIGITNLEAAVTLNNNEVAKIKNFVTEIRKALGDNVAREVCDLAKAEAIKETGIEF